ncbi:small integral membrane protein 11A-like isoform X1 [Pygocentrus nattereri]|uniref:small integral membrane protein 11A-like isoform X1 n=1 Tax=Pygocentrus nattereri TaxID=42514 RepID=UPI0018914B19|nr:small integral membrane protein 11A-like isoform X1 [Pygocentrus nattereri]
MWSGKCFVPYHVLKYLQALDNVPLLLYILAAKTLLLCLAFAGAKLYQQKKAEAALKQQMEMKRKLAQQTQELLDNKKDD